MSYNKQLRGVSCYGLRWRKPNPLNLIWVMPAKGRLGNNALTRCLFIPQRARISTDSRRSHVHHHPVRKRSLRPAAPTSRQPLAGLRRSPVSAAAGRRHLARTRFSPLPDRDYLFLLHFARAYALLVSKLRTLPEMRAATASLNGIVAELPLHVAYCAEWG